MLTRSRFHPLKETPEIKVPNEDRTCNKLLPTSSDTLEPISEMKQNKSTTRRRVPQVGQSSYILDTKDSKAFQNSALKSHYCLKELKKHDIEHSTRYVKKLNRPKIPSTPCTKIESKRNENNCDVTFLRKLLAMNKKEELVLNRKLAKLVLEEEFGLRQDENRFTNNLFSKPHRSEFNSKRGSNNTFNENNLTKTELTERTIANKSNNISKSPFRAQYDINGRRIYYNNEKYEDSEDEDRTSFAKYTSESEDESPPVQFAAGRSKTYINTTTVIQTKSDITCDSLGRGKISSRRNSMTLVNPQALEKKENRVQNKSGEGTEDESKYKKCLFTKVGASGTVSVRGRRETSPGDGVQNVVVHCCEVAQDKISSESKKKVLKVWNFNDIPKIKPTKLDTSSVNISDVRRIRDSQAMWNRSQEMKRAKDNKSTRNTSATQINIHNKQESRPNTAN